MRIDLKIGINTRNLIDSTQDKGPYKCANVVIPFGKKKKL